MSSYKYLNVVFTFIIAIFSSTTIGHNRENEGQDGIEGSYNVKTGLDIIAENDFKIFKGKRVGIICNHTARDRNGRHIVDLINENKDCKITAIFAPEHGYRGLYANGKEVKDEIDPETSAKIYSLYGKTRKPTKDMLKDIDVLVYDIQDVGARFYTYISTMNYAMEAAAENKIPFFVLDRPNPIRGDIIEGPILNSEYKSFVGMHTIPIRYGLTVGELAMLVNGERYLTNGLKADLHVIKLTNWKREIWYDDTSLTWISPSPNITDLETAIVYPGFCLFEGTNISEGRGTEKPFLTIGASWIDGGNLADSLNLLNLKGVKFEPIEFHPIDIPNKAHNPKYKNENCGGVRVNLIGRDNFEAVKTAVTVLNTIKQMYPENFQWREDWIDKLYGSDKLRKTLESGNSLEELFKSWEKDINKFREISNRYTLY
jgi:uncharacterized protein YbbC (DUF1343 family)